MADNEKNRDDEVKDLLARLRSQMSQLDEAFGFGTQTQEATADDAEAPAVASEISQEEQAEVEEAEADEDVPADEAESEEETVLAQESDEALADEEPAEAEETANACDPEPVQIDIFSQLDHKDEAVEETVTEETPSTEEDLPSDEKNEDEEDDVLVFTKEEVPAHIRKERIATAQTLVTEELQEVNVIVTEGELSFAQQPDEQVVSSASVFVPNATPDEEAFGSDTLPFATLRSFDPTKYDEMLAAYEQQKAAASQPLPVEEEVPEMPAWPSTPVLMPITPVVIEEPPEEPIIEETEEDLPEEPVIDEAEEELPEAPIIEEAEEDLPEEPIIEETEEDLLEEPIIEEVEEELTEEPIIEETEEDLLEEPIIEEAEEDLLEEPIIEEAEEDLPEEPIIEETEEDLLEEPIIEETEEDLPEEPVIDEAEEELPEEPIFEDVEEALAEEPPVPAEPRVRRAEADLSDTERSPHAHPAEGRVHLAPMAYRAKDERSKGRSVLVPEEEEDFIDGLPSGIRESILGAPLGRPNRAQKSKAEKDSASLRKNKKKKKKYRFPEEVAATKEETETIDYVRHRLRDELHKTRIRMIAIAAVAFVLLLLENITRVTDLVPGEFVELRTAGAIDALLLVGVMFLAWPRLRTGAIAILRGRVLPESLLFVECVMALIYAIVFGAISLPVAYFSFVPAMGLAVLYSFRVLYCETRLKNFEKINAAGEKLLLSPTAKKDMSAEMHVLGKNLDGETPMIYRIRKVARVNGASVRGVTLCEDEILNLIALCGMLATAIACFLIAFLTNGYLWAPAFEATLFGAFITAPVLFCGVHVYPMFRTDRVAGEDSAVVGETTVKEAVSAEAIGFEDVEAAPSAGVVLSGIQVHCDDPTTVFRYLTALYSHIGGPLCGRFTGMYIDRNGKGTSALVELVDATKDGVSAAIDGAEIVVGNGNYMVTAGITPSYDGTDEKVLPEGKSGILYVAVNGMICMKFYMEHRISAAFEKNVLRLHRLGIATILRTYDPNFNDKTLAHASSLHDCRVHVVSKTAKQRNDFYAEQAGGGIVTSGSSAMLLRLFLLCFRTQRVLRFGRFFKCLACVLGCGISITLTLLGAYAFIPSVYPALYHLVLLAIYMLFAGWHIKLPTVSEGK